MILEQFREATEAAIDAAEAEASAQAAAESAVVAAVVADGIAAVAEQNAAATVASYEERLGACQAELASVIQSQAALSGDVAGLRTELASLQETNQSILSRLETQPETPESPPEQPSGEEAAEVAAQEAEQPASEPEPVKERRRAHRWI